ncbi:MAG: DNA polymerase III subunit alpha [Candidatus Liptonbacteria bacterium]|nr:DNA polymerase III subunit alpha [Candidatus Liptonbacteria bacterium]
MNQRFIHLHNHSHYSLLDGLSKIDDLIARARELKMDSIAITDHGNLYGAIEFYQKAKKAGIKPILGIEAYLAPGNRRLKEQAAQNALANEALRGRLPYYHLILLAENNTGWQNLIKLATKGHLEGFYYKPRIDKELLREHHEGLIALSGCITGEIPRLILADRTEEAEQTLNEYLNIFGKDNFFLEIGHHPSIKETIKVNNELIKLSSKTRVPLCATQDSHYLKKEDAEYHDILLAVQTGNKLTDDDRLTLRDDDFSLRSPEEMAELFRDLPQAIESTAKIADRCNVEIEFGKIRLPSYIMPEGSSATLTAGKNAMEYLKEVVAERLKFRYPNGATGQVSDRIQYELTVIDSMHFANYFLIVQDFINWAKNYGIVVGPGRGSAAGSLVSYVLGITDIDPLKYDLLFERFLNPERVQMPDIDIDFTDRRRDEVLNYVKQKYGEDKVAQIITFGTMAARAAVRDAGRALGMPYSLCDQIAKLIPFNFKFSAGGGSAFGGKDPMEKIEDLNKIYQSNPDARRIIDAAKKLEGVARHASVHACGVVISKDPLIDVVPLQLSPQDQTSIITQFEMHAIEDLGLLKMDFLGLKNLTIIEDALRLVKELRDENINISQIPLDDQKTYEFLQHGETTGVFQFESAGMRRYMKELRPTELEDLIALVSLYRPGPMELIPSYIKRKFGQEKVSYLHPKLEPILKNTYGIGVYQEQMMRIARDLAGFTLAEADTLRKAIGKKIKSLLDQQKEKLIGGMLKNGIGANTAAAIWELFPPFARYGFNRSHAACYALIGYQTAYLKAHYPVEFMASLLNADKDDVDRISFLVNEAAKIGIKVLPPEINSSFRDFMPDGKDIRFGLLAIKNVGGNIVDAITEERARGGPFKNFTDFLSRVKHKDLNKKSLESLLKCGVFDLLDIERNRGLQNIDEILKFTSGVRSSAQSASSSLFGDTMPQIKLRLNPAGGAGSKEMLVWEKELMGLYVSDHPLNQHKEKIAAQKARAIKDLLLVKNSNIKFNTAGLIAGIKKINDKSGRPMLFAKLEDFSDEIEMVVFASVLAKDMSVWKENNAVLITGRVDVRNGDPKLICETAVEL